MANDKQWLRDYEVEEKTNGRISAAWLRKDRVSKQVFPFHRVGRMCLYDLAEINQVIESSRVGGKRAPKQAAKV